MNDTAFHLKKITEEIGCRPAGTIQEKLAAEYMAEQFQKYGAENVTIESFKALTPRINRLTMNVCLHGKWENAPALLLGCSPGTDGKIIEAEPVIFYSACDFQLPDLAQRVHGKCVIHYGTNLGSETNYRKLMEAEPAMLLFTDIRYPGNTPTGDGLLPAWCRHFGTIPSVSIAFYDLWKWVQNDLSAIRLVIDGGFELGMSHNVIADFPGEKAGIIYTGSHLDTQQGTVGADDNASGMVTQLAIAHGLAKNRRDRRTVRQIAFGTEEQLSVGSAAYARAHRSEIAENGILMLNLDSCGSLLGWTDMLYVSSPECRLVWEKILLDHGLGSTCTTEPVPFIDLLPFNACGVPGMWLSRKNCTSGRFYHHRPENTSDKVSIEVIALNTECILDFLNYLNESSPEKWCFSPEIQKKVNQLWNDFFGGWNVNL